ncbi:MAG: N-acetylmuramoyl-L-alanine amidase [Oscillospiraceae bacterium]|nr:N-acetylmuramoyl-L-alanine amidase [Oscillospiraceae bacterium]
MIKKVRYITLLPVYCVIISSCLLLALYWSRGVPAFSMNAKENDAATVIIDAGHGGIDGGATSCTGVLESNINLEIALKLNDLFRFIGLNTIMIRDTDCSVYTDGNTIAQKKVSDLKERVRIVNQTENGILISIHQNLFPDNQYSGAQVFYAPTEGSKQLANLLQKNFIQTLNPTSHRKIKKADGIYLMQHINATGILVECGFLSNHREEYLLRDATYQQKICSVIACTVSTYLLNS